MFPGDPRMIFLPHDLREVVTQMKISAGNDQPLSSYTKTSQEARTYFQKMTEEQKRDVLTATNCRGIVLGGHIISIVLTTDEYHGRQWHLSMCKQVSAEDGSLKTVTVPAPIQDLILKAFFGTWAEISNPGKVQGVSHFVGNDK